MKKPHDETMYIRPNLLWHYEIMNVRPAEWKLFFHVCPDPAQVGATCAGLPFILLGVKKR
jgi:hypothetical protein